MIQKSLLQLNLATEIYSRALGLRTQSKDDYSLMAAIDRWSKRTRSHYIKQKVVRKPVLDIMAAEIFAMDRLESMRR